MPFQHCSAGLEANGIKCVSLSSPNALRTPNAAKPLVRADDNINITAHKDASMGWKGSLCFDLFELMTATPSALLPHHHFKTATIGYNGYNPSITYNAMPCQWRSSLPSLISAVIFAANPPFFALPFTKWIYSRISNLYNFHAILSSCSHFNSHPPRTSER